MPKAMPHSTEAERAVLGALMLSPDRVLEDVGATVRPEDYYHPTHGAVWRAALELRARSEAVDIVTIEAHLRATNKLPDKGVTWLSELATATPTVENVAHHARIVRDRAALRRLIVACSEVAAEAYRSDQPDDLVRQAEQRFRDCYSTDEGGRTIREVLGTMWRAMTQRVSGEVVIQRGVPTGLHGLDDTLTHRGIPTGVVTTVAAPTSTGKSALVAGMALAAAQRGEAVVYGTFEDRAESPTARMLAALSGLPNGVLQRGEVDAGDLPRLQSEVSRLWSAQIHYLEQSPASVGELVTRCRRLVKRLGARLLVLDYLQLLRSGARVFRRQEEVDAVFDGVVDLAGSIPDTATVLVSQLRRTNGERPTREDLYHSGKLEQGSHTILLLWAPKLKTDIPARLCIVEKQKDGRTGDVVLAWDGPRVRFSDATPMLAESYTAAVQNHKPGRRKNEKRGE